MPASPAVRLPPTYRKLCRQIDGSLWLAPDHLFVVVSSGVAESYRRVALRDIQGLFLTFTVRRLFWGVIWCAVAAIAGLTALGIALSPSRSPRISLGFLAAGIIGASWNYLRGPSCRGYLITSVQTLRLPGCSRERPLRRLFRQVEEAAGAAQTKGAA